VLRGMFGFNPGAAPILPLVHLLAVALIVTGIFITHWRMRDTTVESLLAKTPPRVIAVLWGLLAFAIVIEQGKGSAFIYFQF